MRSPYLTHRFARTRPTRTDYESERSPPSPLKEVR